ncbi:MAG: hypothetical protein HYY16_16705 [Planctomycetes bacterium]|nr:hypothetical protein [Planctomycetota bacterium]
MHRASNEVLYERRSAANGAALSALGIISAGVFHLSGASLAWAAGVLVSFLVVSVLVMGRRETLALDHERKRLVHSTSFFHWTRRRALDVTEVDHVRLIDNDAVWNLQVRFRGGVLTVKGIPRAVGSDLGEQVARLLGTRLRMFVIIPEFGREPRELARFRSTAASTRP